MFEAIEKKITAGIPISRNEGAFLFAEADDAQLCRLAQLTKKRFHGENDATYLVMAIVNYTNICVAKCDYCSFYRLPHEKGTYLLSFEQVCDRVDQLLKFGGTLVGFNGGFHPKLRIEDYAELFSKVHARYPDLTFFEMTVAEFMFSCKVSKIPYSQGAEILKEAGTKWVTGGGSEILDNNFRKRHSPGKFTVEDYFSAQRAILEAGLGSTATMVIGFDEDLNERMNHLDSLRRFQDEVGGALASFLCWTYKPFANVLGGKEISTNEYLRWLAICRIFLHNFRHIRTSVLTKNEAALDGIRFGANDFDLPTEDEVTQKAGATINVEFEKILNVAREQGFNVLHRKPFHVRHYERNV